MSFKDSVQGRAISIISIISSWDLEENVIFQEDEFMLGRLECSGGCFLLVVHYQAVASYHA